MGMTPKQIEHRLYKLIDQVAALEARLKNLENPHRLRQMKAQGLISQKGFNDYHWDLATAQTLKWSSIGLDQELLDFVNKTKKDKPRLQILEKLSSCLHPFRDEIIRYFSKLGSEGKLVRLKFRGSVVRGIKAYHKGTKAEAAKFDPKSEKGFDCDAFVEMPDELWQKFVTAGFKRKKYDHTGHELPTTTKIDKDRRYVSLPALILSDDDAKKKQWSEALGSLRDCEKKVKAELKKIEGYRIEENGEADFEFYLRPVANVWWTYKERNPYFSEQDLSFDFKSFGSVNEFYYKDIQKVKDYATEKGKLGKLAPDIQCVIGKEYWYLETEEVFEWFMARREAMQAVPKGKHAVFDTHQNIATLVKDRKIIGREYS